MTQLYNFTEQESIVSTNIHLQRVVPFLASLPSKPSSSLPSTDCRASSPTAIWAVLSGHTSVSIFTLLVLFVFFNVPRVAASTPVAISTTFTVNSASDPGDGICDAIECTLREAISAANAAPDANVITFAAGLSGDIPLVDAGLPISTDLDIQGPGANVLSVSGISSGEFSVFQIGSQPSSSQYTVRIRGLTIQNGGGGIVNYKSNLHLLDSIIRDNQSTGRGGGIANLGGDLTVTNSTFVNNFALSGGGIYNSTEGTVSVIYSTFIDNAAIGSGGGGIHNEGGKLTIISSTLRNNSRGGDPGGGIANKAGGMVTVQTGTFTGNSGSAIYNEDSTLVVASSHFDNNSHAASYGGAIANLGSVRIEAGSMVTITDSTFEGNRASWGGAIANQGAGTVTLATSTLSQNSAEFQDGGGIYNAVGLFTISQSSIQQNNASRRGGGIYNGQGGTLQLLGSTVNANAVTFNVPGAGCGGIANDGAESNADVRLVLLNSTVSGNLTNAYGGGLCNITFANITVSTLITNSTIVFNRANADAADTEGGDIGGGIFNSGTLSLSNSILASNYRGRGTGTRDNLSLDANMHGTIISHGFNLSDSSFVGFGNDDLIQAAPRIAPLANNGGPTATHALFLGSAALDGGSNQHCPAVDQRLVMRPYDGDDDGTATCDIGALEADMPLVPAPLEPSLYLPIISG